MDSAGTSGPSHSVAGAVGSGSHAISDPSGGPGGSVGLQDPPGGTGGWSPTVKGPTGGGSTHLTDVTEPSALALFAAGAGALGLIMRRRRRAG